MAEEQNNSKLDDIFRGVPAVEPEKSAEEIVPQRMGPGRDYVLQQEISKRKNYTEAGYQIKQIGKNIERQDQQEEFIKQNPDAKNLNVGGIGELKRQATKYTNLDAEYYKQNWDRRVQNDELSRKEFGFLELVGASLYEHHASGGLSGIIANAWNRISGQQTALSEEQFQQHEAFQRGWVKDYNFMGMPASKEFMDHVAFERNRLQAIEDMQSGINVWYAPNMPDRNIMKMLGIDNKEQYTQGQPVWNFKEGYKRDGYDIPKLNAAKIAGTGIGFMEEMVAWGAVMYATRSLVNPVGARIMAGIMGGSNAIRNSVIANRLLGITSNAVKLNKNIKLTSPTIFKTAQNAMYAVNNVGRTTGFQYLLKSAKFLKNVGIGTAIGVGMEKIDHGIREKTYGALGLNEPQEWDQKESILAGSMIDPDAHGTMASIVDNLLFASAFEGAIHFVKSFRNPKIQQAVNIQDLEKTFEMARNGDEKGFREMMTLQNNRFESARQYANTLDKHDVIDIQKSKIKNMVQEDIRRPIMDKVYTPAEIAEIEKGNLQMTHELNHDVKLPNFVKDAHGKNLFIDYRPTEINSSFIDDLFSKFKNIKAKKLMNKTGEYLDKLMHIDAEAITKRGHLTEAERHVMFPEKDSLESYVLATSPEVKSTYDGLLSYFKNDQANNIIWTSETSFNTGFHPNLKHSYANYMLAESFDRHISAIDSILEKSPYLADTDLHKSLRLQKSAFELERAIHALESYKNLFDDKGKLIDDFFSRELAQKYGDMNIDFHIPTQEIDQSLVELGQQLEATKTKFYKENAKLEKIKQQGAEAIKKEETRINEMVEKDNVKMTTEHAEHKGLIDKALDCISSPDKYLPNNA